MSSVKRQVILNLGVAYSGVLLAFFNTIFKAKLLSTEEIGVISIITTIAILACFFVNFGLNSIISKFYYKIQNDVHKISAMNMAIFAFTFFNFIIISVLLIVFREFILSRYNNLLLSRYYNLILIVIFSESINKVWIVIFQTKFKSVQSNLIYDFFFKTSTFVLLFMVYLSLLSFHTFIIGFSLLYLFRTILFLFFHIRGTRASKPDFSILTVRNIKIALNYSSFMFFGSLAGILTKTIDKLMLGSMLNVEIVGIYTIIITFPILIQTIGSAFSLTTYAQVSEFWQNDDRDSIDKLYKENTGIQMFLGLFLFGIFSIFGRELLDFIGREYVMAYYAFILLMIGELANVSTGICAGIIAFSKDYKYDFYVRIFLIILTIVTNLIFIPLWGLNGAAFATSTAMIFYNLTKVLIVKIKIGFFPYSKETLMLISSSSLFFFIIYFLQLTLNLENIVMIIFFSLFAFMFYIIINKYVFKLSFLKNLRHYLKR